MDLQTITVTTLGDRLDKSRMETELVQRYGGVRYRDAFGLPVSRGEAWLFDYGVLVCWWVPEDERQRFCHELSELMMEPVEQVTSEQYVYKVDTDSPFKIHNDQLSLPVDDPLCRLGLSHAFAQSAKLVMFEDRALAEIDRSRHLSRELAERGKISLSRTGLAKLRGTLFETSSDISVHFNLLDTPEFFWDYPEQESYYQAMAKYLDLTPRINILNQKLSTIHEMLDMLASEQHHKHSALLEWIIIGLIAMEIVMYMVPN